MNINTYTQMNPFPTRDVFYSLLPTCYFKDVRDGFNDILPILTTMEPKDDVFYNSLARIYNTGVSWSESMFEGKKLYKFGCLHWNNGNVLMRLAFFAFRYFSPFSKCICPETKAVVENRISTSWEGIGTWQD